MVKSLALAPLTLLLVLLVAPIPQLSGQGFSLWEGSKELAGFEAFAQPDDISCGPTAASMVLKYHGISAGIAPLKTKSKTTWWQIGDTRFGMTHPDQLKGAMEAYGVNVAKKTGTVDQLTQLVDRNLAPLLLVRSGENLWHYIVVTGYRHNAHAGVPPLELRIHDPDDASVYWLGSEVLDRAWQFQGDLNGTSIEGRRCRTCGGEGRIGKGWTKCGTCFGAKKIAGIKCRACSGSGKWESPGVHCAVCDGDGKETDAYRKAVESAGTSGHTMLVATRPTTGGNSAGGGGGSAGSGNSGNSTGSNNGTTGNTVGGTATIRASFRNMTRETVSFNLNGGQGLQTQLNAGESVAFTITVDPRGNPTVTIMQRDGSKLPFSLADNGKYDFSYDGHLIKNFFRSDSNTNDDPNNGLDDNIVMPTVPENDAGNKLPNMPQQGSGLSGPRIPLGISLLDQSGGILISSVNAGTPATRCVDVESGQIIQIEAGDYLLAVNGVEVSSQRAAGRLIKESERWVTLVVRDQHTGQQLELRAELR